MPDDQWAGMSFQESRRGCKVWHFILMFSQLLTKERHFPSTAEKILPVWIKGWRKLGYARSPQEQALFKLGFILFTPYKNSDFSCFHHILPFWVGKIPTSNADFLHLRKPGHRSGTWLAFSHSIVSDKVALEPSFLTMILPLSINYFPSFCILLQMDGLVTKGSYLKDGCWKLQLRLRPQHMSKVTGPHSDHPWPQPNEAQVLS